MPKPQDTDYLILGDVLMSYSGLAPQLVIPQKVQGESISRIGEGALMMNPKLKYLVIPEHIRWVGAAAASHCDCLETVVFSGKIPELEKGAFASDSRLKRIMISSLEVSERDYRMMLANSFPLSGGERAMERFPQLPQLQGLKEAFTQETYGFLPKGAEGFFPLEQTDETLVLPGEWNCLQKKILAGERVPIDPVTEEANDELLRKERNERKDAGAVFVFTELSAAEDGSRRLKAAICFGTYFWQNFVPIEWEGQTFYLYQRNFPYNAVHSRNQRGDFLYLRQNMGIYTQSGPVTDQKLAKEIYAKYLLLSIL